MNHDNFTWVLAESITSGSPFLIRYIESEQALDRADYPHRLNVFWTLRSPLENEMPSEKDYRETAVFENRLVASVESDDHSLLVMVLSGRGKKEYVWQTSDPSLFLECLTNMPQEEERYPIEIIHNDDKEWDYYNRVVLDIQS